VVIQHKLLTFLQTIYCILGCTLPQPSKTTLTQWVCVLEPIFNIKFSNITKTEIAIIFPARRIPCGSSSQT
jgi:hypothetical protein